MPPSVSFLHVGVFLALVSLPLVYVFLRLRPPFVRRVPFAPAFLLFDSAPTPPTPQRMSWPLLLLRLLLLCVLIALLSGPFRRDAQTPTLLDAHQIIIIDNGFAAAPHFGERRKKILSLLRATDEDAAVILIESAASENSPPLTKALALQRATTLKAHPYPVDRKALAARLEDAVRRLQSRGDRREIVTHYLSDGLESLQNDASYGIDDLNFLEALRKNKHVRVYKKEDYPIAFVEARYQSDHALLRLSSPPVSHDRPLFIEAHSDQGVISAFTGSFPAGKDQHEVVFPLAAPQRNMLRYFRMSTQPHAGGAWLFDPAERAYDVAYIAPSQQTDRSLLGTHIYIYQALSPYVTLHEIDYGQIGNYAPQAIILNDIGKLAASEEEILEAYVERGGVVLRFAGNNTARALETGGLSFLPGELYPKARNLAGNLSWEDGLHVASLSGPLRAIPLPKAGPNDETVAIKRYLLAKNRAGKSEEWMHANDGTPLITARQIGAGYLVFFHFDASPRWSDIALSSLFIPVLRRLVALSGISHTPVGEPPAFVRPTSQLNAQGQLVDPYTSAAEPLEQFAFLPNAQRPPGFYGQGGFALAYNLLVGERSLRALPLASFSPRDFADAALSVDYRPLLASIVFILLLGEMLLSYMLTRPSARHTAKLAAFCAAMPLALCLLFSPPTQAGQFSAPAQTNGNDAAPQKEAPRIAAKAADAVLRARFAYFVTSSASVNKESSEGLSALSSYLRQRTAMVPYSPDAVDPSKDDLLPYIFIYWPITDDARPLNEEALARVRFYLRQGGMVIFDLQDGRPVNGFGLRNEILRDLIRKLYVPSLTPMAEDHLLTRSYYIVDMLQGLYASNPVLVDLPPEFSQASAGTPSVVIGSNYWSAAWQRGPYQHMAAFRSGVNIAMVAVTGNYKSDHLELPIILRRLNHE